MLNNVQAQSTSKVSQEVNLPDFFSCRNCRGWNTDCYHYETKAICQDLRREGLCAKQMLSQALASGAVQVVLYTPAQLPGGGQ